MIRNFLIRLVINMIAIWITATLLPGIYLNPEAGTLLIFGLVFGIINAIIKPIVKLLTLPLTLATLGLFSVVVNALMLWLTELLVGEETFYIASFWDAILGGIVMGIVAVIVEWVLKRLGLGEDED